MIKNNPTLGWNKKVPQKVDHLSASSVSTYLQCGLKWRLGHVDHLQPIGSVSVHLCFGSAIHKGLEPYWLGEPAQFNESWAAYKSDSNIEYGRNSWLHWCLRGAKMTTAVVDKTIGRFDPTKSVVELEEDIDLGFIVLRRRIDCLLEVNKLNIMVGGNNVDVSGAILADLKTAGQAYYPDAADWSQQLMTYNIKNPRSLRDIAMSVYIVVTKSDPPRVQIIGRKYSREEVKGQIFRIRHVADSIRSGIFVQTKGDNCGLCDYKALCYEMPKWQERYSVSGDRSRTPSSNRKSNSMEEGKAA